MSTLLVVHEEKKSERGKKRENRERVEGGVGRRVDKTNPYSAGDFFWDAFGESTNYY
jgi:hypothetical protein